ncbi:DUF982 domain-containing protein [Shinella sp. BYT-45]|uniref:DUF982 domain-containing protein n=1 Tax=Shinella sp. BYT-45 TaxID=3377377 RepID=UPI0039809503
MKRFEEPVVLLIGLGFPARIESVPEAYGLLLDWPHAGRNASLEIALNACKAGMAGEVEPETVAAALAEFARRNDILIEDPALQAAGRGRSSPIVPMRPAPILG